MEFGDYWFETGTPSYLVELLKHTHYDLYEMANTETDADVLNSIDSASNNPIPVIYQSGYLTIKGYEPEFGIYRLGFRIGRWKRVSSNTCYPFIPASEPLRPPSRSDSSFGRYGLAITTLSSTASKASSPTHPTR